MNRSKGKHAVDTANKPRITCRQIDEQPMCSYLREAIERHSQGFDEPCLGSRGDSLVNT